MREWFRQRLDVPSGERVCHVLFGMKEVQAFGMQCDIMAVKEKRSSYLALKCHVTSFILIHPTF